MKFTFMTRRIFGNMLYVKTSACSQKYRCKFDEISQITIVYTCRFGSLNDDPSPTHERLGCVVSPRSIPLSNIFNKSVNFYNLKCDIWSLCRPPLLSYYTLFVESYNPLFIECVSLSLS